MRCKICKTENSPCFSSKIMDKHKIEYFHCKYCNFIQTEEPYWLGEAYARPINVLDTGYMARNLFLSNKITILLSSSFKKDGRFLDFAGGYGVFVRLMRDIGFEFYWDDKYTDNLFASGFEWEKIAEDIDAITIFECFEHFKDPINEIEKLLNISRNIILSTTLLPKPVPLPHEWWYYGLEHGQHISFYTENTFNLIAKKFGLNYACSGNLHFLTEKKIPSYKLRLLKFTKFGFHTLIKRTLKSKTWEDYLRLSSLTKEDLKK